jgi:aminoglycoside phosphotransferase (APT) family kinase protein
VKLPGFMELLDRIESSAPAPLPATLVHGDFVFANMLWKDGKLTAVLDWELAFNGDPRWDLGYVLTQFDSPTGPGLPGYDLEGFWQREEMMQAWERATGRSANGTTWFQVAGLTKGAAICFYGHHLYATGQSKDERLAQWDVFSRAIQEKAEKLLEVYLKTGR